MTREHEDRMRTVIAERGHFRIQRRFALPPDNIHLDVEPMCDAAIDSLMAMLDVAFLQRKVRTDTTTQEGAWELVTPPARKEVTVRYPASAWEHFKLRWFRGWLLRRFPVRETVVTIQQTYGPYQRKDIQQITNVVHMCPHLATSPHDNHVSFLALDGLCGCENGER
jgi:hypothetical protein